MSLPRPPRSEPSSYAEAVRLHDDTLSAWADHVAAVETALALSLQRDGPFLWTDASAEDRCLVRKGRTVARSMTDGRPVHVRDGLIHHWIGATRIVGATIDGTLAVVQDYDRHKEIYRPDVIDSKLVRRNGKDFDVYLRLLKKKIITVVLDTDHHVEYGSLSATRWWCRSHTTRIAEIEDAGKPTEWARAPDTGYGFLWRLSSYWRFERRDDGVWVECRALSLTRDVPRGLGWLIGPIIQKLPRQSLEATLEATRRGYGQPDISR